MDDAELRWTMFFSLILFAIYLPRRRWAACVRVLVSESETHDFDQGALTLLNRTLPNQNLLYRNLLNRT